MTARILVVDDVEANVRLLEAKLTIEYYDVLTCTDGATALSLAEARQCALQDGRNIQRSRVESTHHHGAALLAQASGDKAIGHIAGRVFVQQAALGQQGQILYQSAGLWLQRFGWGRQALGQ